jgi:hypothetical protein
MARLRKPGAGRKPIGPIKGKASIFSTRITPQTRGALEAEAKASGQSISQAAERLLQLGLDLRRQREMHDPMRALNYLIDALANACRSTAEDGTLCEWNTSPAIFEAFRSAIGKLLDRIRPPGEVDDSIAGPLIGRPPNLHGESAFREVWINLRAKPSSPSDLTRYFQEKGMRPASGDLLASISRNSYAMSDARDALKIKLDGENDQ